MDTTPNRTCLARLPGGELQVLGPKDLHKIDELRSKPEHLVWLDIASPTADHLAPLPDAFAGHPLPPEDLEKRQQRAKLDTYAEQQMLVTYEALEPADKSRSYDLGALQLFAGTGATGHPRWGGSPH